MMVRAKSDECTWYVSMQAVGGGSSAILIGLARTNDLH